MAIFILIGIFCFWGLRGVGCVILALFGLHLLAAIVNEITRGED